MIKQAQTWLKLTQKLDSSLSTDALGHFAADCCVYWGDEVMIINTIQQFVLLTGPVSYRQGPLSQDTEM